MLPAEYDVAMKLASLRPYKYDMSDAVGIIMSENITKDQIEKAVTDFYGGFKNLLHPDEARRLSGSFYCRRYTIEVPMVKDTRFR